MGRWFGRGKKRAAPPVAEPTPAPKPAAAPVEAPPRPPAAPTSEELAAALQVDPAAPRLPPLSPEESAVAEAILTHFDAHRPGPASFPSIALQLLDVLRDPDAELVEMARFIGMDEALSAGVLVLANSPVFRGVTRIATVKDAVKRIGTQEIARMASALSTRTLYQSEVRAEFELFGPIWNRLFYHSATVARAGSELAKAHRLGDPDQVFVAGLLHDVGKSIALRSLAALVMRQQPMPHDAASVERILHRVHVEVGGEVHREWGLPDHLVQVAVRHHDATIPPGAERAEIHVVRITSALHLLRREPPVHPDALAEVVQSAGALGLSSERVATLGDTLSETEEWVRMLFGDEKGGPARTR